MNGWGNVEKKSTEEALALPDIKTCHKAVIYECCALKQSHEAHGMGQSVRRLPGVHTIPLVTRGLSR